MSKSTSANKRIPKPSEKAKAAREPVVEDLDGSDFDDVIETAAKAKEREEKAAKRKAKQPKAPAGKTAKEKGAKSAKAPPKGGEVSVAARKKASVGDAPGSSEDDDSEDELEEVEEKGKTGKKQRVKIDLTWDESTTWSLVNAIHDDDEIRQGLYPDVGANVSTAKGGGKKKIEWQASLARAVFVDHQEYGALFAATANTPAGLKAWALKIKNRLRRLVEETVDHNKSLGATGEGLHADEVNVDANTALANKWQKILKEFPYFAEMRSLIAARPNLSPVGLGNSATPIDLDVLQPNKSTDALASAGGDDECEAELDPEAAEEMAGDINGTLGGNSEHAKVTIAAKLEEELASFSGDENEKPSGLMPTHKRSLSAALSEGDAKEDGKASISREAKVKVEGKTTKSTSTAKRTANDKKAKASNDVKKEVTDLSTLDVPKAKPSKKKRLEDQFSSIAAAEEETRQKELEIAKLKIQSEKDKTAAKLQVKKAQLDDQRKDKESKTELLKLKLEHKHQLRMEKMRLKYAHRASVPAQPTQVQDTVNSNGPSQQYVNPIPTQANGANGVLGGHALVAGVGVVHDAPGLHSPFHTGFGSTNLFDESLRSSSPAGMSTNSSFDGGNGDTFELAYAGRAASYSQ